MAIEVKVPDIGDFKDVPVIEVHVKAGDSIKADDPLLTLESDKATMDVPADRDGTVEAVLIKVGDRVSEGSAVVVLKAADGDAPVTPPPSVIAQQEPAPAPKPTAAPPAQPAAAAAAADAGPGPCQPQRAPPRPRARGRPRQGQGHGREGPDHQGRRQGAPARARGPGRRRGGAQWRHGHPRDPGPGLLQVRPGREQAARAHQAPERPAPASLLAQRPARHPRRRGRHHRDRGLSQGAGCGRQGEGLPRHAAGLPDEGQRFRAEGLSPSSTARWRPRRTR